MSPEQVVEEVKKSGLRGRDGAGVFSFPGDWGRSQERCFVPRRLGFIHSPCQKVTFAMANESKDKANDTKDVSFVLKDKANRCAEGVSGVAFSFQEFL